MRAGAIKPDPGRFESCSNLSDGLSGLLAHLYYVRKVTAPIGASGLRERAGFTEGAG